MKKLLIICCLLAMPLANADMPYPLDGLKQDVKELCTRIAGSYGAAIVKACIDSNYSSALRLNTLPDRHNDVVARCKRQGSKYGHSIVEACVISDIEAQHAIDDF
jgi:hypothetical protein